MNRVLKTGLGILAAIFVLVVLVVGAAVAYTWYVGKNAPKNGAAFQEPVETAKKRDRKPVVDPTAVVGASVQDITSPVAPGANASLSVKTNPYAKCTIDVVYAGAKSKDSGLVQRNADEYGLVAWAWTVESSVPTGKWPVTVTCANEKNSAVVQADLEVKTAQ